MLHLPPSSHSKTRWLVDADPAVPFFGQIEQKTSDAVVTKTNWLLETLATGKTYYKHKFNVYLYKIISTCHY